jgi:FKBP-type peptidyl-prolyl cis-trans isomerase
VKALSSVLLLCLALGVAACGGGDSSSGDVVGRTEPKVSVPAGPPPKKVVVKDLEKGDGAEAKAGDEVSILYVGVRWSKTLFSSSWGYDEVPRFVLGANRLMTGLDRGIRGMRVGGRREVIVPPRGLYTRGQWHPRLYPDRDTVVFVVDLLKVRRRF